MKALLIALAILLVLVPMAQAQPQIGVEVLTSASDLIFRPSAPTETYSLPSPARALYLIILDPSLAPARVVLNDSITLALNSTGRHLLYAGEFTLIRIVIITPVTSRKITLIYPRPTLSLYIPLRQALLSITLAILPAIPFARRRSLRSLLYILASALILALLSILARLSIATRLIRALALLLSSLLLRARFARIHLFIIDRARGRVLHYLAPPDARVELCEDDACTRVSTTTLASLAINDVALMRDAHVDTLRDTIRAPATVRNQKAILEAIARGRLGDVIKAALEGHEKMINALMEAFRSAEEELARTLSKLDVRRAPARRPSDFLCSRAPSQMKEMNLPTLIRHIFNPALGREKYYEPGGKDIQRLIIATLSSLARAPDFDLLLELARVADAVGIYRPPAYILATLLSLDPREYLPIAKTFSVGARRHALRILPRKLRHELRRELLPPALLPPDLNLSPRALHTISSNLKPALHHRLRSDRERALNHMRSIDPALVTRLAEIYEHKRLTTYLDRLSRTPLLARLRKHRDLPPAELFDRATEIFLRVNDFASALKFALAFFSRLYSIYSATRYFRPGAIRHPYIPSSRKIIRTLLETRLNDPASAPDELRPAAQRLHAAIERSTDTARTLDISLNFSTRALRRAAAALRALAPDAIVLDVSISMHNYYRKPTSSGRIFYEAARLLAKPTLLFTTDLFLFIGPRKELPPGALHEPDFPSREELEKKYDLRSSTPLYDALRLVFRLGNDRVIVLTDEYENASSGDYLPNDDRERVLYVFSPDSYAHESVSSRENLRAYGLSAASLRSLILSVLFVLADEALVKKKEDTRKRVKKLLLEIKRASETED